MAGNIGDLQVNLSANTSPMERDVSAALKRLESKGFNFGAGINAKAFTQPLGRITGASNEFQKSLDASNARVIAFGASAGAIYSVQKAFVSLISSTIEVQKSLTDINVILGASQKTLGQFGDSLFKIAKDSGQAFSTVATAAGELARQGLSVEQTLKRTSDALVLARLSGLDAASSVEALTASINSFNTSALDSTQIVNKLASVDAAFAVSSGDLAEALKRVGSSAQDVGVTFDELLAIVASVNQTTARGGAVIGNSLKTIFTRVQRTEVLDQLQSLGVAVRDLNGNTAPAIQILTGLATKFDELGAAQKSQIAELVGGVFQINILKAALGDLSKQYSVYGNALKISQGATDEATRRNEELNKTLSALLNRTVANLTKVGSDIGSLSFAPAIEKVLGGINTALESFDIKGDSIGGKIGKGIFEGIGSFVSGPGLALLIGVFIKLFGNLAKFTTDAVRTVLGLNKEAQAQAQIQERINSILSQNPQLIQNILNKQVSLLQVEKDILTVIQAQSQARQQSTAIATSLTRGLISKGVSSEKGVITARTKSQGFIPNFSANREIMGAIAGGYMPGNIRSMNIPNYGRVTYNDAETVKQFSGLSQPGIMPPANSDAGKAYKEKFKNKYGINPYASSGFVPNFAGERTKQIYPYVAVKSTDRKALSKQFKASEEADASKGYEKATEKGNIVNSRSIDRYGYIYPSFSQSSPGRAVGTSGGNKYGFTTYPFPGGNFDINENLYETVRQNLINTSSDYFKQLITQPKIVDTTRFKTNISSNLSRSAIESSLGQVFEAGIKSSISSLSLSEIANFDLNKSELSNIQQKFKLPYGGFGNTYLADLKNSLSEGNLNSMAGKISTASGEKFSGQDTIRAKKTQSRLQKDFTKQGYEKLSGAEAAFVRSGKFKNQGFIPNFSPLDRALNTEEKMGGRGVLDFKPGLGLYVRDGKTQPNFAAVMRDHPEGIANATQNSKKMQGMMSTGFIPNFAGFDPMSLFFILQSMGSGGAQGKSNLLAEEQKLGSILNQRGLVESQLLELGKKTKKNAAKYADLEAKKANLNLEEISQRKNVQSQTPIFARKGGSFVGGVGGVAGRFGSRYGSGLALAAPLLAGTAAQFVGDDVSRGGRSAKAAVSGLGTTASFAGLGFAVGGPMGAAVGGGIGGIMAGYNAIKEFNDVMPELKARAEQAQEKLSGVSSSTQMLNVSLDTLSSAQMNSGLSAEQSVRLQDKATTDFASSLSKLDSVLPGAADEITNLYKKVGDTTELRMKIAEFQAQVQKEAQISISAASLTSKGKEATNLSESFLDSIFGPLKGLDTRVKNLKPSEKRAFDDSIRSGSGDLQTMFGSFGTKAGQSFTSSESQKMLDSIKATGNLSGIESIVKSFAAFDADAKYASEILTGIDLEVLKKLFEEVIIVQKRAESIAEQIQQQQLEIKTGMRPIRTIQELQQQFANPGGISEEALKNINYSSAGGIEESLMQGKVQGFAQQVGTGLTDLSTTLGFTNDRVKYLAEYTQTAADIQKDYNNGIITTTQAFERLKLSIDKIEFGKNSQYMFSDERASARQSLMERDLKQGNFKEGFDPLTSFFDKFGDNAATTADKINKSFANLASNLQTGFEDAFGAFINGTKTADQAFQDMLLSISQQIIKEQFSIGMRSLLGGLTGGGGFGGTSDNSGGLLGGVFNSIFGGGKAQGGIIRKYSSGGSVNGGSGVRDDVPAMLTDGEYVLRKSAVNKYGKGMLDMLNQGGMVKGYASGGSISMGLANTFDIFDPQGNLVQNPIGQYALERTISSPEELKNVPEYTGKYNISNLLSSFGMTREDNPMNDLRSQNARSLQGYQQNVSNFKTSYNEAMRQVEEQRKEAQRQADEINSQAMAQYNRSLTNTFIGGLGSAGLSLFGGLGGFQALGGAFKDLGGAGFLENLSGKALGIGTGLLGQGGGGSNYQPGAQYNDPKYQEQISKQIESAIQKQTFDRAAMGITSPYQSYGGMGGFGGFGGSQIPYYGSGAGLNVGLGGSFAAPAGLSTFTQNQNYVDQYLTRPAGVIPPTGLVTKPNLMIPGLEGYGYGQGSAYGRYYAKGGRVRKYNTGSEGGVRGDNLTQQEAMILLLNQGINPYLKIKPYVGKSIYGNKKIQGNPNITKDIESILSENPMKRSENVMDYLSREGGQGFSGKNRTELNSLFLASQMQEKFKDRIDRFTGFADEFHDDKSKREKYESYHVGGKAIDFTLKDQKEYAKIEPELMSMFQQMGLNPKFDTREGSGFYRYKLSGMDSKGNPINMGMFQYEVPAGNNTASHLHVELTDEGLNRLEKLRTSNQFAYTDLMPSSGDPFKTMVAEAVNKPAVPVPMKPVTIAGLNLPSRSTNDLVKKSLDEKSWAGYDEYMKNMSLPKANVAGTNTPPTTVSLGLPSKKDTYNIAKGIDTMGMQPNPFANQQPASTITNAVTNSQAIGPQMPIGPQQAVLGPQPFIGPMNRTNAPTSSATTIPQKNYQPWFAPDQVEELFGMNPEISASMQEILKMQQSNGSPSRSALMQMQQSSLASTNQSAPYQSAGNLYDQVGLARNPLTLNPQIPSYLNKYSPFYGSGGDYFNQAGKTGFNNYMNYLGLGSGTSLSSLSSFKFPMTPTTLNPYAFSSSPFGGNAVSYGTGVASASSTYFSAGSRLGATPSWASRATGGMIYGGTSVKDDVPAMLMGGEYVIRKDAVDRFGQPFFDRLNRGQVTGFAEGGPVGTNLPSLTQNLGQNNGQNQDSQTQMTDALTKLLKSLEQLNRSVEDQTKEIQDQNQTTDNTSTTTSEGITNNISINVSVGQDGQEGKSSTDSNSEDNGKGGNDQEKLKKTLEKSRMFAELLRQQVLKTIVEEQRPGGVLYQGSKGRDMGR